jgi:hypothetical protein
VLLLSAVLRCAGGASHGHSTLAAACSHSRGLCDAAEPDASTAAAGSGPCRRLSRRRGGRVRTPWRRAASPCSAMRPQRPTCPVWARRRRGTLLPSASGATSQKRWVVPCVHAADAAAVAHATGRTPLTGMLSLVAGGIRQGTAAAPLCLAPPHAAPRRTTPRFWPGSGRA